MLNRGERVKGIDKARVSERWALIAHEAQSEKHRGPTGWLGSDLVRKVHIQPQVSGDPELGWLDWCFQEFPVAQARRVAVVGCGTGGLERHARWLGSNAAIDAYDISEGSLEVAKQLAKQHGMPRINYICSDLSEGELPAGVYDVVFASMALHHIPRVHAFLERVSRSLMPGGMLLFDEFVGPRKFQWTDTQVHLANAILDHLPERLKRDLVAGGGPRDPVRRPTMEQMNEIDPSEAIESDLILDAAREHFSEVALRSYGGTILHLLLDGIAGNFTAEDWESVEYVTEISRFERTCIRIGVLASDFCAGAYATK